MTGNEKQSPTRAAQLMLRGARSRPLAAIGERPLLIGRHSAADIVVRDPSISRHHALVWRGESGVLVRDLGSALGTRVGSRVLGAGDAREVAEGEDIVLAMDVRLFWVEGGAAAGRPRPMAVIEGEDRSSDELAKTRPAMRLPTKSPRGGTWLVPTGSHPNAKGMPTITVCSGDLGPASARVEDQEGNGVWIRGESRLVLLYMLIQRAMAAQKDEVESAWVEDEDLAVGLWGRAARTGKSRASRLNTVVSRIRGQLRDTGLPDAFLQKESGRTRIKPDDVLIVMQKKKPVTT